ncbi:hypothetical protein HXX76_005541 [Chlamydomonas incerta]|uniref:Peptidase M11 gametolysin domain-containing protein n=1 Tax=Chlamydomonas incerta TaxID=51695 RepID=A0A835TFS2_CHLIN|nr:hypothetical protein HXX76_005541 [Chlamydomonas incerta]|eukprot:KAG2437925.1 hypothetical protein HXX76_005541 [Chlamydomonas incerta]
MAQTLAREGFEVHILSIASRSKVLVHAGMQGLLPRLSFARPGVVSWREAPRLHHHVVLNDAEPAAGSAATAADGGGGSGSSASAAPGPGLTEELLERVAGCVRGLVSVPFPTVAPPVGHAKQQEQEQLQPPAEPAAAATDAGTAAAAAHSVVAAGSAAPRDEAGPLTGLLQGAWVLVDADESQRLAASPRTTTAAPAPAPAPADAAAQPAPAPASGPGTLFEAVVGAAPPRRCVALVQNVHFLPLGPSGTGQRSPALLEAWRRLGGIVAVSGFVAGYLRQHWPEAATAAAAAVGSAGGGSSVQPAARAGVAVQAAEELGAAMPPVRVVPLATWGVFGRQPLPDLSPAAHAALLAWRAAPVQRGVAGAADVPAAAAATTEGAVGTAATAGATAEAAADAWAAAAQGLVVDVAVLKLTPEKGCSVVAELARRLAGRVRFRVVAGDPAVARVLEPLAAAGALQLWEPQPSVTPVLQGCVAVLAPSLWLEAWGMVVTEALLHGLPAVVSDLGGLPEAGMGVCPAVPVEPVRIPLDAAGVPDWAARQYPRQDVGAWEAALLALLLGTGGSGAGGEQRQEAVGGGSGQGEGRQDEWLRVSASGRQAALAHALTTEVTAMVRYMEGAPSAVRHSPPPRRRPPPTERGSGRHAPPAAARHQNLTQLVTPPQLQLACPQIYDPASGYSKEDPFCNTPRMVLAYGAAAEQLRNENGLLSGDIVNVTLGVAADGKITLAGLKSVKKGSQYCKCIFDLKPADDRAVLYLLDFSSCPGSGMAAPAALTPEAARSLLLPTPPNDDNAAASGVAATSNLKAYQDACSYGKRLFNSDNVAVVGPVPVPCTGALTHPRPTGTTGPRPDLVGLSPAAAEALRMNSTHAGWWDLSRSCSPADMHAIERAAEAFAQQLVAKDPSSAEGRKLRAILQWRALRRNIYVLPPGSSCAQSWPAIAEVSCTSSTCGVFVDASTLTPNAAAPHPPHILMHELLHVLGLTHADRGSVEAGDPTDIMGTFGGAGAGLLCPNAPNQLRIGWVKHINEPGTKPFQISATGAWGNLTATNFTGDSGNWIRGLVLPAQGTRDDNMVAVNVGVESSQVGAKRADGAQAYYFSYRIKNTTAGGYDSGLPSDFHKKVLVHAFNGIQSERVFGFKTNLLDWGPSFQQNGTDTWTSPFLAIDANGLGGGVRLVVQNVTDTQAIVDICRITENGREDSCTDGLDNDCDGKPDSEDPDCQ